MDPMEMSREPHLWRVAGNSPLVNLSSRSPMLTRMQPSCGFASIQVWKRNYQCFELLALSMLRFEVALSSEPAILQTRQIDWIGEKSHRSRSHWPSRRLGPRGLRRRLERERWECRSRSGCRSGRLQAWNVGERVEPAVNHIWDISLHHPPHK